MPTVARWINSRQQWFTDAGAPLNGGKLYFYQSGSTTPLDTYNDNDGITANSNPVELDTYGRPTTEIWMDSSYTYKVELKTSAGTLIWTEDNVEPIDRPVTALPVTDTTSIAKGSLDSTKTVRLEVDGVSSATTRVLTVQDASGAIALTSEFAYASLASTSGRLVYPRGYISGLILSNNGSDAVNDIDIAVGACRDGADTYNMILSGALTKRLDAAWAVGTNQGGLDGTESVAGTPDTSTWYHVWLIMRPDTGVVDVLFSESASAPTMPTNYTVKRLIGSVYNDSGGDIDAFTAVETAGGGTSYLWSVPTLDINLANTLTTTARTDVLHLPTGYKVDALLNTVIHDATSAGQAIISSPDMTDAAPSTTVAPLCTHHWDTAKVQQVQLTVRTNTSGAIRARSSVATTDVYYAATLGWTWGRV
jgi:hypothetical protein